MHTVLDREIDVRSQCRPTDCKQESSRSTPKGWPTIDFDHRCAHHEKSNSLNSTNPSLAARESPEESEGAPDAGEHVRIASIADPVGVASSLVRVAQRGKTWGLARRFSRYEAVSHEQLSVRGAAPKFILRAVDDQNDWYIVKSAEKWGSVETLTELLNNLLGNALGFPMAHAGILRVDGDLRFASHNFQKPNETLIHGSLLFTKVFDDNLDGVGKKTWDEQRTYDVDLIRDMLDATCGAETACGLFAKLIEMLVFDALIGSMDRHMQNWGVLATVNEPRTYRFAPIFDSARALLWDKDESKLEMLSTQRDALHAYVKRSRPIMGCATIGKSVNHFDLVEHLIGKYPAEVRPALNLVEPIKVARAVKLMRQFPFNRHFSRRRVSLITEVLTTRAAKLHQIAKGGKA
jgi:hypothetical protein